MRKDIRLLGFDPADESPVDALHRLFGMSPADAARLVASLPRVVKREVEADAAERIRAALASVGGRVVVEAARIRPAGAVIIGAHDELPDARASKAPPERSSSARATRAARQPPRPRPTGRTVVAPVASLAPGAASAAARPAGTGTGAGADADGTDATLVQGTTGTTAGQPTAGPARETRTHATATLDAQRVWQGASREAGASSPPGATRHATADTLQQAPAGRPSQAPAAAPARAPSPGAAAAHLDPAHPGARRSAHPPAQQPPAQQLNPACRSDSPPAADSAPPPGASPQAGLILGNAEQLQAFQSEHPPHAQRVFAMASQPPPGAGDAMNSHATPALRLSHNPLEFIAAGGQRPSRGHSTDGLELTGADDGRRDDPLALPEAGAPKAAPLPPPGDRPRPSAPAAAAHKPVHARAEAPPRPHARELAYGILAAGGVLLAIVHAIAGL